MFLIHRQLGNPEVFLTELMKRVRVYAEVDEKIPDSFSANDNWVKGLGRML